jgi:hypothetical protein
MSSLTIEIAKSRPGLKKLYKGCSVDIQHFFQEIPLLLDAKASLDTILAYAFFCVEQGHHLALLCGARKLHNTELSLTRTALDVQHMTRKAFEEFFYRIFGFKISDEARHCISRAEKIRDLVMHGKGVRESDKREAISLVLHYASIFNGLLS